MSEERRTSPGVPRVSERDKEYMRKIGRYKAEANAERLRRHLELPMAERFRASIRLSRPHRSHESLRNHIEQDDPAPLYQRARKLRLV
jgi:hypothetical protein